MTGTIQLGPVIQLREALSGPQEEGPGLQTVHMTSHSYCNNQNTASSWWGRPHLVVGYYELPTALALDLASRAARWSRTRLNSTSSASISSSPSLSSPSSLSLGLLLSEAESSASSSSGGRPLVLAPRPPPPPRLPRPPPPPWRGGGVHRKWPTALGGALNELCGSGLHLNWF